MYEVFRMFEYPLIVLILFFCIVKSTERKACALDEAFLSVDVSIFLKAICCVVIVLHHYACKTPNYFCEYVLAMGGGGCAVPIFFVLSGYGICKSEMKKSIPTFAEYCRKRLLKILVPLFLVVLFFEIFYVIFTISTKWCYDVYWFIWEILIFYILFYVAKSIFPIINKKNSFFILFSSFCFVVWIVAYMLSLPAYYHYLWSFVLGVALALYEKKFLSNKFAPIILIIMVFCGTYIQSYVVGESRRYAIYASLGIIGLLVSRKIFFKRCIRRNSIIEKMGIASYEVYLVHMFILLFFINFITTKFKSLILFFVFFTAYCFKELSQKVYSIYVKK